MTFSNRHICELNSRSHFSVLQSLLCIQTSVTWIQAGGWECWKWAISIFTNRALCASGHASWNQPLLGEREKAAMFISAAPVGVCATACAHTLKDILNPTIRDFYTSGKYKLVIFHFSFLVSEEITNHFLAGNLIKAFMKLVVLILGYQMCSSQMFRSGSSYLHFRLICMGCDLKKH